MTEKVAPKEAAQPGMGRTGGKSSPKKIRLQDRRHEALGFRRIGYTFREIAAHMKVPEATARLWVKQALEVDREALAKDAAEYRVLELERLENLWLEATRAMKSAVDNEARLRAVDRLVKISERRSKLLALDMTSGEGDELRRERLRAEVALLRARTAAVRDKDGGFDDATDAELVEMLAMIREREAKKNA